MLFAFTLVLASTLLGDPAFDEGVKLYKQTEYEQAVVRFQELSTRAGLPLPDKAEALLWLGLSQAGSGEVEIARATFREALETEPALALPPLSSPSIVKVFEELRAEVIAARAAAVPAPAPSPEAPTQPGPGSFVVGGGVAAAGAAALLTGGVLAVLASGSLQTANDKQQFQSDAKQALDDANAQTLGAGLLLPLGVALGVAGGALIVMSAE